MKTHQPCPDCGSSDALTEYSDGHTFCFSCSAYHPGTYAIPSDSTQMVDLQYLPAPGREISRDSFVFYDVKTEVEDGVPKRLLFPYANGRIKIRDFKTKEFRSRGQVTSDTGFIFGRDKFPAGSAQAITIVEGEFDALAAFEMLGSKYPVVSVSSASSARNDCSKDFDYLNSFERIYLCLDMDEVGQEATQAVASLFDFNKIYHVKMELKDANEYLIQGRTKEFVKTWWNSKRFLPEGVISSFSEFDSLIDNESEKAAVPYPLQKLQAMTYGIRPGELNLFTAQEGIGKTEVFRLLEYNLLKNTDANIGIIHLEESKPRTIKGLAGYELEVPAHLPDSNVTKDEIKNAFRSLAGRDERLHIYTHFGSDDPDTILNAIRFMAGPCNCKYIFLDHITLVVTGLQVDDERKTLDYISTKLAMMVEDMDFSLFLISHVNDDGLTRGSRNISKVADLHVHLDRDVTAPTEEERSMTYLTVKKNRFAGKTGPGGVLMFDKNTFMLNEQLELPS